MHKQLTLMLDTKFAGTAELVMKARFKDDTLLALLCPKDQVANVMASQQKAFCDMHPSLSHLPTPSSINEQRRGELVSAGLLQH